MTKILLVLSTFVFSPVFGAPLSDDFYSSFRGKLLPSDSRALNRTCGRRVLPVEVEFRAKGSVLVRNKEYPWTLRLRVNSFECSAVLISTRHVLTAAHCATEYDELDRSSKIRCLYSVISAGRAKVYPGTKVNDLSSIPIYTSSSRIVTVHPRFDPCSRGNDLAVLEISPNMFSDGSPICMPSANESVPINLSSTGFGLNPDEPKTLKLQAVNLTRCRITTRYEEIGTCTLDRIPCDGDSGGPLFKNENGTHILLGICLKVMNVKKGKRRKKRKLFLKTCVLKSSGFVIFQGFVLMTSLFLQNYNSSFSKAAFENTKSCIQFYCYSK